MAAPPDDRPGRPSYVMPPPDPTSPCGADQEQGRERVDDSVPHEAALLFWDDGEQPITRPHRRRPSRGRDRRPRPRQKDRVLEGVCGSRRELAPMPPPISAMPCRGESDVNGVRVDPERLDPSPVVRAAARLCAPMRGALGAPQARPDPMPDRDEHYSVCGLLRIPRLT